MSVPGHPHDRLLDRIDGHLDPAEAARVDAHVAGCADCQREMAQLAAGRAAARTLRRDDAVPVDLRASVMAALDGIDREQAAAPPGAMPAPRPIVAPRRRFMQWGAVAAAALLAIVLIRIVGDDAVDHVARTRATFSTLQQGTLALAVRASSAETLQRYFDGAVTGQRVRVIDLGMMGWRLEGGVVRPMGASAGALYTYRSTSGDTRLMCEMFPERLSALPPADSVRHEKGFEFRVYTRDGVTMVFWQEGDLVCVLVAALPPEDVVALAVAKAMAPV